MGITDLHVINIKITERSFVYEGGKVYMMPDFNVTLKVEPLVKLST